MKEGGRKERGKTENGRKVGREDRKERKEESKEVRNWVREGGNMGKRMK